MTSPGNPYAHLVLRGGESGPNYSTASLEDAMAIMNRTGLKNAAVVVDASHDNCRDPDTGKKDPIRQSVVVNSTLDSMEENELAAKHLKGWMIESFLQEGSQDASKLAKEELVYGVSITDPCINLFQLTDLVYTTYDRLGAKKR
jgi:3-deoxy-7-phosphoheptulonate synthase